MPSPTPGGPQPSGSENPWLTYGVPLALGGLNYAGTMQTNAANAQQAKDQMAFQERMSNTEWQRSIADMKAAGVNPALAYMKGGASAPTGAQAQMQNAVGAGANSAAAAMSTMASLRETASRINSIDATTQATHSDTALKNLQWTINNFERADRERTYEWMHSKDREGKPVYSRDAPGGKTGAMPFSIWLVQQQALTQLRQANSASAANEIGTRLNTLGLPKAEREADMYKGAFGKVAPYINSARDAASTLKLFQSMLRQP